LLVTGIEGRIRWRPASPRALNGSSG
jgi:hypothetical protein